MKTRYGFFNFLYHNNLEKHYLKNVYPVTLRLGVFARNNFRIFKHAIILLSFLRIDVAPENGNNSLLFGRFSSIVLMYFFHAKHFAILVGAGFDW